MFYILFLLSFSTLCAMDQQQHIAISISDQQQNTVEISCPEELNFDKLFLVPSIRITRGRFTEFPDLRRLVHLNTLIISDPNITDIDQGLLPWQLKNLVVENNSHISELTITHLSYLERLECTDLSKLKLVKVKNTNLTDFSFKHVPALAKLKLSKNRIQHITADQIPNSVTHLDVSHNPLKSCTLPSSTAVREFKNKDTQLRFCNNSSLDFTTECNSTIHDIKTCNFLIKRYRQFITLCLAITPLILWYGYSLSSKREHLD